MSTSVKISEIKNYSCQKNVGRSMLAFTPYPEVKHAPKSVTISWLWLFMTDTFMYLYLKYPVTPMDKTLECWSECYEFKSQKNINSIFTKLFNIRQLSRTWKQLLRLSYLVLLFHYITWLYLLSELKKDRIFTFGETGFSSWLQWQKVVCCEIYVVLDP